MCGGSGSAFGTAIDVLGSEQFSQTTRVCVGADERLASRDAHIDAPRETTPAGPACRMLCREWCVLGSRAARPPRARRRPDRRTSVEARCLRRSERTSPEADAPQQTPVRGPTPLQPMPATRASLEIEQSGCGYIPNAPGCLLKDPAGIRRRSNHARDDRRVDRPCLANLILDSLARLGRLIDRSPRPSERNRREVMPRMPESLRRATRAGDNSRWFAR